MVFLGLVLLEINLYTGFIYEKIVISKDRSNLYKNGFRNIRLVVTSYVMSTYFS